MDHYHKDIESSLLLLDNRPLEDFEELSKADMRYLIHNPFSKDSPLQINRNIPANVLDQIHLFNQMEFFLERLIDIKELKLTGKGFLPTALVKEIYNNGSIKEEMIEDRIIKLYSETSSDSVHLTRLIAEQCGFLINNQNKLSLTPEWCDKLRNKNRQEIFLFIFSTFTQKFDWKYIGFSPNPNTGQIGFAFSLFLLSKYGNIQRQSTFYTDKYIKAFPFTTEELTPGYLGVKSATSFNFSYLTRTIECFLGYFNLATYQYVFKPPRDSNLMIKKSKIFDKIVTFD